MYIPKLKKAYKHKFIKKQLRNFIILSLFTVLSLYL